jgi:hypothetical protein
MEEVVSCIGVHQITVGRSESDDVVATTISKFIDSKSAEESLSTRDDDG